MREWYNIGSPVKGLLWRGEKLREEERKLAAELAKWYTFVVFLNGGEKSVAEIQLKCGVHRASWPDVKAKLVSKLGTDGLLGVERGRSYAHKTFTLQYIDPYQKAAKTNRTPTSADADKGEEGGGAEKVEATAEVEEVGGNEAQEMGRVVVVRNEMEWQQVCRLSEVCVGHVIFMLYISILYISLGYNSINSISYNSICFCIFYY